MLVSTFSQVCLPSALAVTSGDLTSPSRCPLRVRVNDNTPTVYVSFPATPDVH